MTQAKFYYTIFKCYVCGLLCLILALSNTLPFLNLNTWSFLCLIWLDSSNISIGPFLKFLFIVTFLCLILALNDIILAKLIRSAFLCLIWLDLSNLSYNIFENCGVKELLLCLILALFSSQQLAPFKIVVYDAFVCFNVFASILSDVV